MDELARAAEAGDYEKAEAILKKQPKPGPDALILAIKKVMYDAYANYIYEMEQKYNVRTGGKIVPMPNVESYLKVVRVLLEHKADPNLQNTDGDLPLFLAGIYDLPEFAELLVEYGADVNKRKGGMSALEWAALRASLGVVKVLLKTGKIGKEDIIKTTKKLENRLLLRDSEEPDDPDAAWAVEVYKKYEKIIVELKK